MAGNLATLHLFANDVGPEALSLLDNNFTPLLAGLNSPANFGNYYADSGVVNALAATLGANQSLPALVDGLLLQIKVANTTTTTTPTLNVNGLGAKTIVGPNNTPLSVGQLVAGTFVELIYDFTNNVFRLLASQVAGATGLFASGTAANPSISFVSDNTTGLYLPAALNLGFAVNGIAMGSWLSTTGLTINAASTNAANNGSLQVAFNPNTDIAYTANGSAAFFYTALLANNSSANAAAGVLINLSCASATLSVLVYNNPAVAPFLAGPTGPQTALRSSGGPLILVDPNGNARFMVNNSAPFLTGAGPVAGAQVDMTPDGGTFTGTLTGCTTAPTATVAWTRVGNLITIALTGGFTATSNTTACSITGGPAILAPTRTQQCALGANTLENNTASIANGGIQMNNGSATINLTVAASTTGFTAAGTKGVLSSCVFSYLLN